MSAPFNRGTFSLSNSKESPCQKSPELSTKFVKNNNFNLSLLLEAASNNNNTKTMLPGEQSASAAPDIKADSAAMELQQAIQLSLAASQNQQAAHPSALFATNRTPAASAPLPAQLMTQLQAQQFLNGGQVNANHAAALFAPPSLASAPAQAQASSAQGNNVINQLVASLQAQQQAQQQAQVQAAIARAFGPGGGGGLSTAGFAAPHNTPIGMGGVTSFSQPSARDILSRMQLVQDSTGSTTSATNSVNELIKLHLEQNRQNQMFQQAQQSGELHVTEEEFAVAQHNALFSHKCCSPSVYI